jgi:hypothetical protein
MILPAKVIKRLGYTLGKVGLNYGFVKPLFDLAIFTASRSAEAKRREGRIKE